MEHSVRQCSALESRPKQPSPCFPGPGKRPLLWERLSLQGKINLKGLSAGPRTSILIYTILITGVVLEYRRDWVVSPTTPGSDELHFRTGHVFL